MATDTLTTNYGWVLPADQGSDDTWGAKVNATLQAIDSQVWTNAEIVEGVTGQLGDNNLNVSSNPAATPTPIPGTISFNNSSAPTGQQLRWQWQMDTTAESGTAAGSNLNLIAYNNTGVALPTAATFSRTSGMTFNVPVTFGVSLACLDHLNITGSTPSSSPSLALSGGSPTVGASLELNPNGAFTIAAGANGTSLTINNIDGYGSNTAIQANCTNFAIKTLNLLSAGVAIVDPTGLNILCGLSWQQYSGFQGLMILQNGPSGSLQLDHLGNFTFNGSGNAYKAGGGSWAAIASDARVKTVEGDYELGLDAVIGLRPVVYRFKGNDGEAHREAAGSGQKFVGLIAQEVENVMPGMVSQREGVIDGETVTDLRVLDTSELIFALVNAVRQLKAEVDGLREAAGL